MCLVGAATAADVADDDANDGDDKHDDTQVTLSIPTAFIVHEQADRQTGY